MDYWENVRPTYIENWPAAVCSLSIAQVDVPLTIEDARRLGTNIMEFGEAFCATEDQKRQQSDAADRQVQAISAKMYGKTNTIERVEWPMPTLRHDRKPDS